MCLTTVVHVYCNSSYCILNYHKSDSKLLTIGTDGFSSFGCDLGTRGNGFLRVLTIFWAGFSSIKILRLEISEQLFRLVCGVFSGEELNSLLSSLASFSGGSACIFAKRFLRAAAIMAAGSPAGGVFGRDLTGVPPGDL